MSIVVNITDTENNTCTCCLKISFALSIKVIFSKPSRRICVRFTINVERAKKITD